MDSSLFVLHSSLNFSLEFCHKLNDDFIFFGWLGYAILGIEVFFEVYSYVADERLGEA